MKVIFFIAVYFVCKYSGCVHINLGTTTSNGLPLEFEKVSLGYICNDWHAIRNETVLQQTAKIFIIIIICGSLAQ